MKRAVNRLLGYAVMGTEGAFAEELLNLCARCRIPFWGVVWEAGGLTLRVRLCHAKRLRTEGERRGIPITEAARRGGGAALLRWRRRWGFLGGMGLAFLAAAVLSRFILTVEVTGNESVPDAVILSQLQRQGVRPGVYGPALERTEIANRALAELPQLSFLAVNLYGTRAEVVVREAIPAPELLDESTPADVVAERDGILLDIHTAAGEARFADGDVVGKGEVLISGDVTLSKPEGSEYDIGTLVVRAAGEARARTWRTVTAVTPLFVGEKTYTGEETTRRGGKFLWMSGEFFRNSGISYAKYDKITQTRFLRLFGRELPIGLTAVTFREYTVTPTPVDAGAAETRLREELLGELEEQLQRSEGTLIRADFVCREADGLLTVTMLAECEEEIGVTVERAGETGRFYAKEQ